MHALAITSISLIALTYVANFYNLGISNNSYEDQLGVAMLLAFVFVIAALLGFIAVILALIVMWVNRKSKTKHFWLALLYLLSGVGSIFFFSYLFSLG